MLNNKLVLIDGNSIAFRAFYALPLLNNSKGVYTNAIYGFAQMVLKAIEEEDPTHILVAFDAGKTTFRHQQFEEYKAGREKTPRELSEQIPLIHKLLDAFRIPRYELELYEADDIIGTLAKQADEKGWQVKIISGDKDLLQLVSENVTVALTRRGITEVDEYDPSFLMEKYELKPNQIIDMKSLMGDSSDNIPGVPGIGEKTAIKLLKEFGTLETILASIDKISGKKMKERLEEHKELAQLSKELVTINCKSPITISLEELSYTKYDHDDVIRLFNELEFSTLLKRMGEDLQAEKQTVSEIEFDIITDVNESMLMDHTAIIIEVMQENYHEANIEGIAFVNSSGNYFITFEDAQQSEVFKAWLEDSSKKKVTFDMKRAIVALSWKQLYLKGVDFDVLIASYLLNTIESRHDISEIASRENISIVQSDESIYGKGAKRKVPEVSVLAEHLVRKAQAVYELKDKLAEKLVENDQMALFEQLEMPLASVLAQMELQGITVHVQHLKDMGNDLDTRLHEIEQTIYEQSGVEFNINSPKQLGEVLFEKLDLPVIKRTKTGYSTSADVLEKLAGQHDIIPNILLYRQLKKLYSTYIEGLLKEVSPTTGKIHTRFNQVLTQTGRLSSTDPNLQNIPIRLEEGREIRRAFTATKEDWVIFAADYSQIELRVLAHIAQDKKLIQAFQDGMDIHTKTAMDVFHVSENEVTSLMRRHAKAVNFGIIYGISDYGLSQSLQITRKEASEFITRYLESYPNVKRYMDEIVQQAKRDGYVTTLLQRRRYLPGITSSNFNVRSFAERTAMNTPIQGSAADIIKKAMIDLSERLRTEKLASKMLLQVHDELIFEVPKHEIDQMLSIVPEVMEGAVKLDVPIQVDCSYGKTWYEA